MATLLPDGTVLVAGGGNDASPGLRTAEIYDPDANAWIETPAMAFARSSHSAVLLRDGRVLVVAGFTLEDLGSPQTGAAAEIFDPAAGRWSSAGHLAARRFNQGAALMRDGRVMVAGGDGAGYLSSVEIYDPRQNAWSEGAPMTWPRNGIALLTLGNGEVLAVGGIVTPGFVTTTAETYDPQTNTWSPADEAKVPRYYYALIELLDGRILVAGGCCEPVAPYGRASAEIFTPDFVCAPEVTNRVDVVTSAFFWIPFTPLQFQWVVIRNRATVPIAGPLAFVMDDLRNAVFVGSPFRTRCLSADGDPLMIVVPGADGVLSPNESTLTPLWFFMTRLDRITYSPRVLSGLPLQKQ